MSKAALKRADLQLGSAWTGKKREGKTAQVIKTLGRIQGDPCVVASVERVDHVGHKHDLYGLFDLLVIYQDRTVGVQVCGSDWGAHIKLYKGERLPNARRWLDCPSREFQMWGWRKLKRRGKGVWIPRVQQITPEFLRGDSEPKMLDELSEIFEP